MLFLIIILIINMI